jgi:hypothetical protein
MNEFSWLAPVKICANVMHRGSLQNRRCSAMPAVFKPWARLYVLGKA